MSAPKWDGLILARNGALGNSQKLKKQVINLNIRKSPDFSRFWSR